MFKLFSLKDKEGGAGGGGNEGGGTSGSRPRASAAQLRITKDISEMDLPKTCRMDIPDPDCLLQFKLIICPDEGFYRNGT